MLACGYVAVGCGPRELTIPRRSVNRRHAVDLDLRALPEKGDAEARARGQRLLESLAVDPVHRVEILLVDELDLGTHDTVEPAGGRLQDLLEVVDGLVELGL